MAKYTLDELDRLAAEKIMGWELRYQVWFRATCGNEIDIKRDFLMSHNQWQPTKNIAQAWQCLEKLREDGWFSSCTELTHDSGEPDWMWGLIHIKDGITRFTGRGPAPLAIVTACLKAKGIEW